MTAVGRSRRWWSAAITRSKRPLSSIWFPPILLDLGSMRVWVSVQSSISSRQLLAFACLDSFETYQAYIIRGFISIFLFIYRHTHSVHVNALVTVSCCFSAWSLAQVYTCSHLSVCQRWWSTAVASHPCSLARHCMVLPKTWTLSHFACLLVS